MEDSGIFSGKSKIHPKNVLKGAAILTTALAWNSFAEKFIDYLYPINKQEQGKSAVASLLYAVFVTLILVTIVLLWNLTADRIQGLKTKNRSFRRNRDKSRNESISR